MRVYWIVYPSDVYAEFSIEAATFSIGEAGELILWGEQRENGSSPLIKMMAPGKWYSLREDLR